MSRFTPVLARLLVSLTVVVAGVGVVELAFGAWLYAGNLNRLNLIKDKTFRYAASGLYETASPTITYTRDKYGLRGAYGKDPSRIDILTVGGSTTDQRYISDGSTWQDVLELQFAAAGTSLKIANAGVDGQSTFGHLKNFEWWFPHIPGLKPKYILFYIGLNDFHRDEGDDYDALSQPDRRTSPLIDSLKDRSALWNLARTAKALYRGLGIGHARLDFGAMRWTYQPIHRDYAFMSARLEAYAGRLRMLADRTQTLGSRPIFVSQATRQFRHTNDGVQGRADITTYDDRPINGVDYYHMTKKYNAVMEAVARERNLVFIDVAAESRWEDDDFYDFAHMTPKGARKLGLHLFGRLRTVAANG